MRDPLREIGLFASLSRLLATVLHMAQVRLQLLGTEVELEKRRLFDGLLWAGIAIVVLVLRRTRSESITPLLPELLKLLNHLSPRTLRKIGR